MDGSDNSLRALDVAVFLAKKLGAKLVGLYSIRPLLITEAHMADPFHFQHEERKYASTVLANAESSCEKNDIDFAKTIEFGSPGPVIVESIKNNKIDLVVMGSRGTNAVKVIFLGSVSNFVLHKSPVPVLIVK